MFVYKQRDGEVDAIPVLAAALITPGNFIRVAAGRVVLAGMSDRIYGMALGASAVGETDPISVEVVNGSKVFFPCLLASAALLSVDDNVVLSSANTFVRGDAFRTGKVAENMGVAGTRVAIRLLPLS